VHLTEQPGALAKPGALIVGEPTGNYPCLGHKGAVRLHVRTKGVAAHGSMPQLGDNAIHKAADVVQTLRRYRFSAEPHPYLGEPTLSIGTIHGGTNINSVPDLVTIGVDVRLVPGQDTQTVISDFRSLLGDKADVSLLDSAACIATDERSDWVQLVFGIMEPVLGQRPQPRGVPYFTDASALAPALGNTPTILLGPGEAEMAHKTDEYCLVSRIEQATEAYTRIASAWCLA
jgi:succinyl-diaminopimelate desuccinylase